MRQTDGARHGIIDMEFATGEVVSEQYQIIEVLGRGGFGVVYRAHDTKLDREVALKILLHEAQAMSPDFVQRFQREIRLIRKLEHPNVVRLYDYGERNGTPFMVMEFVRGTEVADRLQADGAMSWRQARHVMLQMLDGLVIAHQLGIVHRDLKPNNLMLTEVGMNKDFVKVLDFGIAKAVVDAERETKITFQTQNQLVGTPSYMAPEQLRQEPIGPPADVYAAGLILIELLTGKALLEGTMVEVVARHIDPRPHELPPEALHSPFADFIRRAISKAPDERFADAAEMYQALEAINIDDYDGPGPVVSTGPNPTVRRDSGRVSADVTTGALGTASTVAAELPDPGRPTSGYARPRGSGGVTSPLDAPAPSNKLVPLVIALTLLVLAGVGVVVFILLGSNDTTDGRSDATQTVEAAEVDGVDPLAAAHTDEVPAESEGSAAAGAVGTTPPPVDTQPEVTPPSDTTPPADDDAGATTDAAATTADQATANDASASATDDESSEEVAASAQTDDAQGSGDETAAADDEDASGGEARDDDEDDARRSSKKVKLRVVTDPPRANVVIDGKACRSPCAVRVDKGDSVRIVAKKRGYRASTKTVEVDGNEKIEIKLYRGL